MTNRFQTPCFDCQSSEFRFFDGACAVTSSPLPPTQGCPRERGVDLTLRINCSVVFYFQQDRLFEEDKKKKHRVRKEERSNYRSVFFFLALVWFAVLQLHLIPTGKPSSGTDFRAPRPGLGERGDCSVKKKKKAGSFLEHRPLSQSVWLKGVGLNYTQWLGPAPRHDPGWKTQEQTVDG